MNWIGEFFCSKKHYERVIQQTVRDYRDEYIEALADGRRRGKLLVIHARNWMAFAAAMVNLKAVAAIGALGGLIKVAAKLLPWNN